MKTSIKDLVNWIRKNNGRFPSYKATDSEEKRLYNFSKKNNIVELRKKYFEVKSLEEVPIEYRMYIALCLIHERRESTFGKVLEWMKENNRQTLPQTRKNKPGKKLSKKQTEERNLYVQWNTSNDRRVLERYIGVQIQEIPLVYRKHIRKLREYGYGLEPQKEESCYPELIEWLETHSGYFPRKTPPSNIPKKERRYEANLRKRWEASPEKVIFESFFGVDISNVPDEYKEMVGKLRYYKVDEMNIDTDVFDDIIKWLDAHNGKLPKGEFRDKKAISRRKLTFEQRMETLLYSRWIDSDIRKSLEDSCEGKEIPEEHKDKVAKLKEYGLGKKKRRTGNVYEEYIKWLEEKKRKPSSVIYHDNRKHKLAEEMTEDEKYEISLYHRWFRCDVRKALNDYATKKIEDVPEEYRDKIAKLRSLGDCGISTDEQIKRRARRAVTSKNVTTNAEVREELGVIPVKLVDPTVPEFV